MKFPLGDLIRSFFGPETTLGRIFRRTKGISLGDIALDTRHGISRPGESKFDRTPSRPKPPIGPAVLAALSLAFVLPACDIEPPVTDTPPPPCIEGHIWGDGINAYHLKHGNLNPVLVNNTRYEVDVESWNALMPDGVPLELRTEGEGFVITINEGGDRNSGWLGKAEIAIGPDGHIMSGTVTMNVSILDDYTTNTALHVLCQEIGHELGLEHNRKELDTCMNDCPDAPDFRACLNLDFGTTPNDHDGATLRAIYAHATEPPTPPCGEGLVILHTFPELDPEVH